MMHETMAYLAGLFDGEGCIQYKQYLQHRKGKPRAYKFWNIRIEINMTCKKTIDFVSDSLGCGAIDFRAKYPHQTMDQWRGRCSHRDAYEVAKALIKYSVTKKDKFKKIVDHYENNSRPN